MFILYFLALIPCIIGLFIFLFNKRVCWKEWLIGSAVAFLVAIGFHAYSYHSQIGDTETWSGQIISVQHIPEWREKYKEAIYRTERYRSGTDSNGRPTYSTRQVFSHYETRYQTHRPKWILQSNLNTTYSVSQKTYEELKEKFGKETKEKGHRKTGKKGSTMVGGDPYDYFLQNINNWVEPINIPKSFQNRLKASGSIFKHHKVSGEFKLFEYPYSDNQHPFTSNRLMGEKAYAYIDPFKWEQLNAVLGPIKKINLICVGVNESDPDFSEDQIAYWLGGKKNDLIIIFGNGWSRVYSWSESELCKNNIASLFLNPSEENLLENIKQEILKNYEKVDFSEKFSYIQIQPKTIHVVIFMCILMLTQIGLYASFHFNEFL